MGATAAIRMQADRLTYPAMLVDEIVVWKAWLKLHETEFTDYQYNVRIGRGHDAGPQYSDAVREMWKLNTQLRLDALAYSGATPTIFEVKRRATPASIGQILTYKVIWDEEHPQGPPAAMVLVANTFQPNIMPAVLAHKIRFDIVKADFSILSPSVAKRGTAP